MKNKISGLLMEVGAPHTKQRLLTSGLTKPDGGEQRCANRASSVATAGYPRGYKFRWKRSYGTTSCGDRSGSRTKVRIAVPLAATCTTLWPLVPWLFELCGVSP